MNNSVYSLVDNNKFYDVIANDGAATWESIRGGEAFTLRDKLQEANPDAKIEVVETKPQHRETPFYCYPNL
jgi:hypothetical protein